MTDPKKNPNKRRKLFFWRRKALLVPELPGSPCTRNRRGPTRGAPRWYRASLLKVAVDLPLAVAAILPTRANGQFGVDVAAILAALSQMQSLMNTYIVAPLKTINRVEQSVANYEQQVMYPLAAINQAKNSVMQFESQFSQIGNLFHVNVASATLPQSQNLETTSTFAQCGKCAQLIWPVSECVWGCDAAECCVPADENDDRHDRCAGPGRHEASD